MSPSLSKPTLISINEPLSLSLSPPRSLPHHQITMASLSLLSLRPLPSPKITSSSNPTLSLRNHRSSDSFKLVLTTRRNKGSRSRGGGPVCYAVALGPQTLQWVSAVSCGVLMLAKGTAIQKSLLVPLFALQAPATVISWIKGEYGTWTAFLALLVRLFYFIPGDLDLPFSTLLFVIAAPYQTMSLRGSQAGVVISLAIAGYLAFQHFSRAGSLRRAFDQVSVIATLAIICITVVSCFFCF